MYYANKHDAARWLHQSRIAEQKMRQIAEATLNEYPLATQVYDEILLTGGTLADLIARHQIHIAPYDAIVYARVGEREVGVKYSATGGDKAKAVRLAVREVLRLVGVVS